MRTAAVLMTGLALLVAGILVLALTGATVLGIGLVAVGLLIKVGGVLLGDDPNRATGPTAVRSSTPRAGRGAERSRTAASAGRGVTVRTRRPSRPAAPSVAPDHGRRRAS